MSQEQPLVYYRTNVLGTKNVANLCLTYQIEKMILVSTDKAIEPINVLGATKLLAEKYLRYLSYEDSNNCSFVTCRFGNVLESRGSVLPLWKMQIANGGPITITHPEATRFFMSIKQAGAFLLTAGAIGCNGDLLWYDIGESIKIQDLAKKMITDSGQHIDIKFVGLRPGEKLHEESMMSILERHERVVSNIYRFGQKLDRQIVDDFDLLEQDASSLDEIQVHNIIRKLVPEFVNSSSQLV